MKLGIVGYGASGSLIAKASVATRSFVISAICDPDIQRLAHTPAGASGFMKFGDLLQAGCFEALAICTPTPSHVDLAKRAMAAGAKVLVEKPLATERMGLRELARAAEGGPSLFALMHTRYGREVGALRRLVEAEKSGGRVACNVFLQDDHLQPLKLRHAMKSLISPWIDAGINGAAMLRWIFPQARFVLQAAETIGSPSSAAWGQCVTYELAASDVRGTVRVETLWSVGKRRKFTEIAFPDRERRYCADHRTGRVWSDRGILHRAAQAGSAMECRYEAMMIDAATCLAAGKSNWTEAAGSHEMYIVAMEALGIA